MQNAILGPLSCSRVGHLPNLQELGASLDGGPVVDVDVLNEQGIADQSWFGQILGFTLDLAKSDGENEEGENEFECV